MSAFCKLCTSAVQTAIKTLQNFLSTSKVASIETPNDFGSQFGKSVLKTSFFQPLTELLLSIHINNQIMF